MSGVQSRGKSTITVEKIGGTSMTRFGEILDNIVLRNSSRINGRIYVVSAYGGVTDLLLEHKKRGEPGVYSVFASGDAYAPALEALREHLCGINSRLAEVGLNVADADAFIRQRVNGVLGYLRSMNDVLASGYVQREAVLSAARELLASIGESHSAYNSAAIVRARGYQASCLDLSGWADPTAHTIDERIASALSTLPATEQVTFVTGYCKGTEGIMREFDRGYSEVTFSKVAVATDAAEAVIHKEFHLSSADPNLVGLNKVAPVCNTNFDVADQLADVGMEAIHPKASKPLELKGIPLRVMNAFDPEHDGTLITTGYTCPESKIEIVTGSDKVSIVELHDTRMVSEVGTDFRIMKVLVDFGVSYISKTTNANTIDLVLWDRDLGEPLLDALRVLIDSVEVLPTAIVCAIGSNIAKPGILTRATSALAQASINVIGLSQTARQTNMQFTVQRSDFKAAQCVLHAELCEK